MFGGKGKIEEIVEEADGKVLVNIRVERINRKEREVRVKVFERGREKNVLDARYLTSQSELYAYYGAQDIVKKFIRDNDYVIDTETTNVELPSIKTTTKRMR